MNLEQLLETGIQLQASDLHILPGAMPLLRVNGHLAPIKDTHTLTCDETEALIYSILTEDQKNIFKKELVCETAFSFPCGNFRLSAYHQLNGIAGVVRIVPSTIPDFDTLGLPQVFKTLLALPHGLILVAGATGSGKSTTLAAMIEYINQYRACNIITIEDPIEFIYTNKNSVFNQLQVGRDTHSFAAALKASLRQDPNVILLGELRDLETMRLSLTAAETGHLVLATIHASSASLAINRFADVFPSEEKNRVRSILSETLQAVIYQTLVKKTTGGRVAAFEVLLMTPSVRHYIRQDMPAHMESTMQTSSDKGMHTLEQYLEQLVNKRIISSVIASGASISKSLHEPPGPKTKTKSK